MPLLVIGSEGGAPMHAPLLGWVGMTTRLAPARLESIMTDFVVGFFEKYLMGRSPAMFDGLGGRYPEVTISKRNDP